MSEKEKKIIETIAEALPNMSERDKGYFLGYAEAKADKTPVVPLVGTWIETPTSFESRSE